MNPIDIGRDEARRRAIEELAKPGYGHESLPGRVVRVIQQFFGDLTDQAGGPGGGEIALIVLVVIVGGLVVLLLWWYLRKATRSGGGAGESIFGSRERTAAEHREAAEALAASGQWAEAIRERLRAIARDLEERAVVDAMPGRTADELADTAGRELPAFAAELADAARLFDDVTYGEAIGTAEGYSRLTALDERLRAPAKAR